MKEMAWFYFVKISRHLLFILHMHRTHMELSSAQDVYEMNPFRAVSLLFTLRRFSVFNGYISLEVFHNRVSIGSCNIRISIGIL